MQQQPLPDLKEICQLLLTPTAENLTDVNVRLETLARSLALIQTRVESGEPCPSAIRETVVQIKTEITRVRHLLDGAAHFFNNVESRRQSAVYGRNGCVRPESVRFRTLAHL